MTNTMIMKETMQLIEFLYDEKDPFSDNEPRFRLLADVMPLLVWSANANGEMDFCNNRWEIYTGFTPQQTEGWGWASAVHADDLQYCIENWTTAYVTGQPYEIEFRLKAVADGNYRWHLGNVAPYRDDSGTIVKWFGTATDIDDLVRVREIVTQAYIDVEKRVEERAEVDDAVNRNPVRQNETGRAATENLLRNTAWMNEIRSDAFDEGTGQILQLMAGLVGATRVHQTDYETNKKKLSERRERVTTLRTEIAQRVEIEYAVRANELRTRHSIESACDAFIAINANGAVIDWNEQAQVLFGWSRQDVVGKLLADLIIPDRYRQTPGDGMKQFMSSGSVIALNKRVELIGQRRGGEEFPVELTIRALQYNEHDGYEFCAFLRDITERKNSEQRLLYLEKARAEITLNSISDAVIGTDITGHIDYLNVAAEKLTGWTRLEALGRPVGEITQIINGTTRKRDRNPVEIVLQQNMHLGLSTDTVLVRRDGSEVAIEDTVAPLHDVYGRITGAVMVFHDISAAQTMAMKMAHLAQHDFLTNLPNRLLLNDRIAQAIVHAERRGRYLAVLFLDLDNFKHINDSLGHAIGDKLLQSVAQRLCACVRISDTVSRQGGDEFVILLAEENQSIDSALIAEKILSRLTAPHAIDKHLLHVTASIGISTYPADAKNAETLIKNADTAMYYAKEKGRNNHQFFKSDMNVRAVERQVIESNLRHALEHNELILHYQPKVNLKTGAITGAEALIRWQHPKWGLMLPDRFVPIAEECGLIIQLGRWVLREACVQNRKWNEAGLMLGSIAVNISALEFRRKDFVEEVGTILQDSGLSPDRLQLEITESVLMRDAESSRTVLQQLKTMGVQLAVDDFGTGYSSLSYLHQFPIDVLKIDQSFVQDIATDKGNGIIVSAVIAMGNSLKQRVVAEGVEQQIQLAFLQGQLCEEGQGYLFSRPLCAEQFAILLATGIASIKQPNTVPG